MDEWNQYRGANGGSTRCTSWGKQHSSFSSKHKDGKERFLAISIKVYWMLVNFYQTSSDMGFIHVFCKLQFFVIVWYADIKYVKTLRV